MKAEKAAEAEAAREAAQKVFRPHFVCEVHICQLFCFNALLVCTHLCLNGFIALLLY